MRRRSALRRLAALALVAAAEAGQQQQAATTGTSASTDASGTGYQVPGDITMMAVQPALTEIDPDAVCNDGSPAYYYWADGTDPTQWIIYLQGGDWCYSAQDCQSRWGAGAQERMSSNHAPTFTPKDGILGTTGKNPWGNANKAYLRTCSSDAFVGDASASPATGNYAMRGARQVAATVQALVQRHGMGATEGHTLLLAGCSSGAMGVLNNLDAIREILPDTVTLSGLIDAAAWVDIPPMDPDAPGQVSIQTMTQGLYAIAHPTIPPQCSAAYPGEEWKCIFGQYRLPFVQTPYFLFQGQFDTFEMLEGLDGHLPKTPPMVEWADGLQNETLQLFQTLNPAIARVFSTTCEIHCVTIDDGNFFQFKVEGETVADAMGQWAMGQGQNIISSCQGFDCTNQCGGTPWSPQNKGGNSA